MRPVNSHGSANHPAMSGQNDDPSTTSSSDPTSIPSPPRVHTVERPRIPDVMEIDTDEPELATLSPRGIKRKADERESSTPDREACSEPELKRQRSEQTLEAKPSEPAPDGKRPWHQALRTLSDSEVEAIINKVLEANATGTPMAGIGTSLFGEAKLWGHLNIKVTILLEEHDEQLDLLRLCGACVLPDNFWIDLPGGRELCKVALTANDFDHIKFEHTLMLACKPREENSDFSGLVKGTPIDSFALAVQWGKPELVQAMIAAGADINKRTDNGSRPLNLASFLRLRSVAKLLVESGADGHLRGITEPDALSIAAHYQDEEICRLLLDRGATGKIDWTHHPLDYAVVSGNTRICRLLLERLPDAVAQIFEFELRSLIYAAERGHEEVCRLLIESGAPIDEMASEACDVMSAAAGSGIFSLVKYLRERGLGLDDEKATVTPLMAAAEHNQLEMLEFLLSQGVRINRVDEAGWTALMYACFGGSTATVASLLANGADPTINAGIGRNAMVIAAISDHLEIVRLLINHGLDLNAATGCSKDVLNNAVCEGHVDIVRLLLESGLNIRRSEFVTEQPAKAEPPLLVNALKHRHKAASFEIVDLLLRYGAPLDVVDDEGNDPLMQATKQNELEAMRRLLLSYPNTLGHRNQRGDNALVMALHHLNDAIVESPGVKDEARILMLLINSFGTNGHQLQALAREKISSVDYLCQEIFNAGIAIKHPNDKAHHLPGPSPQPLESQLSQLFSRPYANSADAEIRAHEFAYLESLTSNNGIPAFMVRDFSVHCTELWQLIPILEGEYGSDEQRISAMGIAGMLATLERDWVRMAEGWDPLAKLAQDSELHTRLTKMTRHRLRTMADYGIQRESEQLGLVFGTLPEVCLALALESSAGMPSIDLFSSALTAPSLATSAIVGGLCKRGIYAPLAKVIAAAWTEACAQLPTSAIERWQHAAGYLPLAAAATIQQWTSLPFNDDDPWLAEMVDAPAAGSATLTVSAPPMQTDIDDLQMKERLSDDFRQALRRQLAMSGESSLLRHPQVPAEAVGLYADLMFRQVHMLSQFVTTEKFDQQLRE